MKSGICNRCTRIRNWESCPYKFSNTKIKCNFALNIFISCIFQSSVCHSFLCRSDLCDINIFCRRYLKSTSLVSFSMDKIQNWDLFEPHDLCYKNSPSVSPFPSHPSSRNNQQASSARPQELSCPGPFKSTSPMLIYPPKRRARFYVSHLFPPTNIPFCFSISFTIPLPSITIQPPSHRPKYLSHPKPFKSTSPLSSYPKKRNSTF